LLRNSSFVFRDAVFQRLRETVRRVKKNRACGRGESLGRKRPRRAFTVRDCIEKTNAAAHKCQWRTPCSLCECETIHRGLRPELAFPVKPGRGRLVKRAPHPGSLHGVSWKMMLPDIAFFDAIAEAAAAETLPRFRMPVASTTSSAGFDPVTEADRAAERRSG
jgi:hypothetical protein